MARSRRSVLGTAALAASSAVVLGACAGIIGLDEFQKGECAGAICFEGGAPDVFVPDSATDGGVDASVADARGSAAASWAKWKMPNDPIDAGPDATIDNPVAYEAVAEPKAIKDKVTGLVWRTDFSPTGLTYDQAVSYCATLGNPGDWRLPKRIELVSLLEPSRSPAIDSATFPGTLQSPFWSSSEVRDYNPISRAYEFGYGGYKYWAVSFSDGSVTKQPITTGTLARCVKGSGQ